MNKFDEREAHAIAKRVRVHILDQVIAARSGHIGGSFSCAEILVVLYFYIMKIRPQQPQWPERDRFILGKGHCTPALYAVLAERGYFDTNALPSFRSISSVLQGHPDMQRTPGVDMSTGSLGQGLSVATGMALALRYRTSDARVFALLGDGELQEGQVWEALMCAAHYRLDNLIAIIDDNGLQIDGTTTEVMSLGNIAAKLESFGWHAVEIDGHDPSAIYHALSAQDRSGVPLALVARTVKGRGVSFMENVADWHGRVPNSEQAEAAYRELGALDRHPPSAGNRISRGPAL